MRVKENEKASCINDMETFYAIRYFVLLTQTYVSIILTRSRPSCVVFFMPCMRIDENKRSPFDSTRVSTTSYTYIYTFSFVVRSYGSKTWRIAKRGKDFSNYPDISDLHVFQAKCYAMVI